MQMGRSDYYIDFYAISSVRGSFDKLTIFAKYNTKGAQP